MSNTRDLLTEAIAEAKAVKETAIANAKAALEEAFTPHLKDMLSAKLEEMDKEEMEESYDTYEESDITSEEVSEEMDDKMKSNDEMDEDELENYYLDLDSVEEVKAKEKVEETEEVEEEIDLDELLSELEEGEETEEITEAEEEIEETVTEAEEDEVEDEVETEEEVEDEMDAEEIDLEDMSEDDLKSFIEDVIKNMVEAGELEAGDDFEGADEMSDEEEIEIEDETEEPMMEEKEELDEMDEVSWNEKNNPTRGASGERDPKKVGKSTSDYAINEEKLAEALAEVEALKVELQETNLLNAKLLYTNKIFKSKNLTESKKVKVLKAFDKAESVKEAKVIFETLNEGMVSNVTKSPINEIKGSASKSIGVAPTTQQPIVENDAFVRMQKLAGIIKEN